MSEARKLCFVIMPFDPELHYFYLYFKHHIESKHTLRCERADERVLTIPILDKITSLIREAEVVIADCSGRNANVFYELGIAHASNKQVILITKDAVIEAPSDIRHFEFIRYSLGDHVSFLERLDNALHHILFESYEPLYHRARAILSSFVTETEADVETAERKLFLTRIEKAHQKSNLPDLEQDQIAVEFLLPKIIADPDDAHVMKQVAAWLSQRRNSALAP